MSTTDGCWSAPTGTRAGPAAAAAPNAPTAAGAAGAPAEVAAAGATGLSTTGNPAANSPAAKGRSASSLGVAGTRRESISTSSVTARCCWPWRTRARTVLGSRPVSRETASRPRLATAPMARTSASAGGQARSAAMARPRASGSTSEGLSDGPAGASEEAPSPASTAVRAAPTTSSSQASSSGGRPAAGATPSSRPRGRARRGRRRQSPAGSAASTGLVAAWRRAKSSATPPWAPRRYVAISPGTYPVSSSCVRIRVIRSADVGRMRSRNRRRQPYKGGFGRARPRSERVSQVGHRLAQEHTVPAVHLLEERGRHAPPRGSARRGRGRPAAAGSHRPPARRTRATPRAGEGRGTA